MLSCWVDILEIVVAYLLCFFRDDFRVHIQLLMICSNATTQYIVLIAKLFKLL